ncbi:MAG: DUF4105 domain-containing protein [Gemmatimonadaceae bacterium]
MSVVLTAAATSAGAAQLVPPSAAEPGSELTVYVVTLGQGDQVWERYGHNALWIRDDARGTNETYNWGIFDASGPDFILRFVRGRMRYWMESVDIGQVLAFYRAANRSITVQRLTLTPAQALALRDFAEWNEREENKYYWYDYFRDNCSTRLRDAVDRALGGALKTATSNTMTPNTYRSESVRLMEGMPLTQMGIAVGLGPLADRPLTAWEEMFVPMRMRDRLREVRVRRPDGAVTPLVAEERQLYTASRAPELLYAPPLARRYAVVGVIVGGLLAALGWLAGFDRRGARAPFAGAAAAWALVTGVGGLLLVFLWLATHHMFAYRNENLLHLNPLAIVLVVLAPLATYRPRARGPARVLAVAIAVASLLGVVLYALGLSDQATLPAIALVLPAHIAAAWAFARLARVARARASREAADARGPGAVPRAPAPGRAHAS